MASLGPDLEDPWTLRRRVVFGTLAYCAVSQTCLQLFGADTRLNETLALGNGGLAGAVIMAYVFGSAYDASTRRSSLARVRTAELIAASPTPANAQRAMDMADAAG
jgi:hypothetical protein